MLDPYNSGPGIAQRTRAPSMLNDAGTTEPSLKAWGLNRTFGSGEMLMYALRDVGIELASLKFQPMPLQARYSQRGR